MGCRILIIFSFLISTHALAGRQTFMETMSSIEVYRSDRLDSSRLVRLSSHIPRLENSCDVDGDSVRFIQRIPVENTCQGQASEDTVGAGRSGQACVNSCTEVPRMGVEVIESGFRSNIEFNITGLEDKTQYQSLKLVSREQLFHSLRYDKIKPSVFGIRDSDHTFLVLISDNLVLKEGSFSATAGAPYTIEGQCEPGKPKYKNVSVLALNEKVRHLDGKVLWFGSYDIYDFFNRRFDSAQAFAPSDLRNMHLSDCRVVTPGNIQKVFFYKLEGYPDRIVFQLSTRQEYLLSGSVGEPYHLDFSLGIPVQTSYREFVRQPHELVRDNNGNFGLTVKGVSYIAKAGPESSAIIKSSREEILVCNFESVVKSEIIGKFRPGND